MDDPIRGLTQVDIIGPVYHKNAVTFWMQRGITQAHLLARILSFECNEE